MNRVIAACLCLSGVLLCSCTAVPMPVLASAGVEVAEASTAAFIRGNLEGVLPAPMEAVQDAALRMTNDLGYAYTAQMVSPTRYRMVLTPRKGDVIVIRLDAHTPRVTRVHVKVGLLGDQALSRFLLEQLDARMKRTD